MLDTKFAENLLESSKLANSMKLSEIFLNFHRLSDGPLKEVLHPFENFKISPMITEDL